MLISKSVETVQAVNKKSCLQHYNQAVYILPFVAMHIS